MTVKKKSKLLFSLHAYLPDVVNQWHLNYGKLWGELDIQVPGIHIRLRIPRIQRAGRENMGR